MPPGPPYPVFHAALELGDLRRVRRLATEMPSISLPDALRILVLLREQEPENFEAARFKWLRRYVAEQASCVDHVGAAVDGIEQMQADPRNGLAALAALCS